MGGVEVILFSFVYTYTYLFAYEVDQFLILRYGVHGFSHIFASLKSRKAAGMIGGGTDFCYVDERDDSDFFFFLPFL